MKDLIDLTNLPPVARLDEYFGLWAIEETRFLSAFDRARTMDLKLHVQQAERPKLSRVMLTTTMLDGSGNPMEAGKQGGSIAVIPLTGTLMKQVGSMEEGTSTVRARADIRRALNDESIGGILLLIDSPGGTVSGSSDLAAEIVAADAVKPVYAFAEDLLASAAYRVAIGARKIFANEPGALVGSIGTLIAMFDYSAAAAMQGIKAKVYKSGELKASGMPGTEITPAQDAYFQGIVDQTQKLFGQEVMQRRGLDAKQLKAVSTGAVFMASEAQRLGLIDGIQSLDATIAALSAECQKGAGNKKQKQAARGGHAAAAAAAQNTETVMSTPKQADGCMCACPECVDGDCASCSCGGCQACTDAGCEGDHSNMKAEARGRGHAHSHKETAMENGSPTSSAPAAPAATLQELKAALPKATSDFVVKALEDGLTVSQAKDRALEAQQAELEDLRAKNRKIGTQAIGGGAGGGASAAAGDFDQLVAEKVAAGMDRRKAITAVAKANPDAYEAYKANLPRAGKK